MDQNRCVCCGEAIPEGMQVCPKCMKEYGEFEKLANRRQRRQETAARIMEDWVIPIGLAAAFLWLMKLILRA